MASVTPFLWFDGNVREAVDFYLGLFEGSTLIDSSPGPDGTLFMATIELSGQRYMLLDGGPHYTLNPAFSMFVSVEDQPELDHFWNTLCADGGEPGRCGWLVDRFGLSWQIVPTRLGELLADPDRVKADRVQQAMLAMNKLDIAGLQAAYDA
jgi:predicted 3-demethylubiquinone-9 3-methyltransferase (glyoxalase superfamily)